MQKQDCMIDYKDDEQKIISNTLQSQHTITLESVVQMAGQQKGNLLFEIRTAGFEILSIGFLQSSL